MKSPFWIVILVFGGVGAAMLVVAVVVTVSTIQFRANAQFVEGTVVELVPRRGSKGGTSYATTFEFTDLAGRPHRLTTGSSSSPAAHDVGEKVRVYFDPEHPDEARLDGFMENWFLPLIFGFFGVTFGGIGGAFLFVVVRKMRLRAALRASGRRTACRVVRVEQDTSMRINGRHPWRLKVEHQDPYTGRKHTYRSDTIYFDPTDYVTETIDVLIDPHDPKKYWVDVSALEQRRSG